MPNPQQEKFEPKSQKRMLIDQNSSPSSTDHPAQGSSTNTPPNMLGRQQANPMGFPLQPALNPQVNPMQQPPDDFYPFIMSPTTMVRTTQQQFQCGTKQPKRHEYATTDRPHGSSTQPCESFRARRSDSSKEAKENTRGETHDGWPE